MKRYENKSYVSPENVVSIEKIGNKYYMTTNDNNKIEISQDIYTSLRSTVGKEYDTDAYVNADNVVIVEEINSKYYMTTSNNNKLEINKDLYDYLKTYSGGGGGGGGGTEVSAITTAGGPSHSEGTLTGLQINDLAYKINTVSANPGGTGTVLTTLKIDNKIYLIPAVYNKTITIKKNGETVDSFKLNQNTDKTINIPVPAKTSDLTNDSGFITGITSSDVTTALGYTPGTSNFSGDYDDLTDKPDLSVYELAADAFSGDYDDLTDKPDLSIYAESNDLATVATSGDYDDLVNKPTIPAAQVNSDWNADSGVAQILNKPSLAAVAISGSYDDLTNKPTIPEAQVNADWEANSGIAQILNKPSLAAVATSGDYDDLLNTPLDSIIVSQVITPATASQPELTTTEVTIDGVTTTIDSYTKLDSALAANSKNPVQNNVIFNALSAKANAEDLQGLEQIALTINGIKSGVVLSPVETIIDGNYYPTADGNHRYWNMQKSDSPTYWKVYDVHSCTSVHLKAISRAGYVLTNSAPADFLTRLHQDPEQVTSWREYPEESGVPAGTNSEQAYVQPRTGYTPYDIDITTNGKLYLIVYEGNAGQALEVTDGAGYTPITTSMFQNDGDGLTQNDPYAKVSQVTLSSALTATVAVGGVTVGDSWPAGTSLETILRAILAPSNNNS